MLIEERSASGKKINVGWEGIVENLIWTIIIGHIIHWAVDAVYYLGTQWEYDIYSPKQHHKRIWDFWLGDLWDRAPVHISNMLGAHWFAVQTAPEWWLFDRHAARYLVTGILTGVVVFFLFSKPRRTRKDYAWYRMLATPILALLFAIPGVALGGALIWKVPWLNRHGFTIHSTAIYANEGNSFLASGKLDLLLLGLLGSWLFARFASMGPADETQWFFAERKAYRMAHATGLTGLAGRYVIGPPGYRARVYAMLRGDVAPKEHGNALIFVLLGAAVIVILLAGFGAWLTLAGPAAGAA